MRRPAFHPCDHVHDPLGMDLLAWLALVPGVRSTLTDRPGIHA